MKKLILLTALLLSVVCGKSVEQLQSEWKEKITRLSEKQSETFWQSADAQRLDPHCRSGDKGACIKLIDLQDKYCQNGFASICGGLAQIYLQGDKQNGIKIDENKAKSYANKACKLDKTICAMVSGLFSYKSRKIALQYAKKACEMGESMGCGVAFEAYSGQWESKDIKKDIKKVKYYESKLCKAGVKETCK